MAKSISLSPDADISGNWVLSTGSDYYAILGTPEDGQWVSTPQIGRHVRMTLEDFDYNYDSIISVQVCISGYRGGRSGTHDVTVDIENDSNVDYYSDTHILTGNGGIPATYCSSEYTTSDGGSTAWTLSDLNNLRIYFQSDEDNVDSVYVHSTYINVVYTIPTYTSDDNIIIKNGLITLKNGLIDIK
ncbi:MAG: hypothetical protein H8D94_01530 [Candidatus Pelagibacter sp.]|nr:hypothetical protein [Candidatus Pelagibacter sp.]